MFDYTLNDLRGFTPATIRAAFNKSREIVEETGDMGRANVSSIVTHIIHAAGFGANRRHASDIVYGLDKIRSLAENRSLFLENDDDVFDEIITFGVREDGVDHNAYIMSTLLQTRHPATGYVFPKHTYRQILAVRMRAWVDHDFHCARISFSLRDITNSIHSIDPADMMPDTYAIRNMPFEDRKNPEPTEERNRIDDEEIRKLREAGYRSYGLREITGDILTAELCDGSDAIKCLELDGFWDPRVTAPTDPSGNAIARIWMTADRICIVSWMQPDYRHFGNIKELIETAKATLRGAFDQDQSKSDNA